MKYEECKIYSYSSTDLRVVFSYAGFPDSADNLFKRIMTDLGSSIAEDQKSVPLRDKAHAALQEIYRDKHTKGLQTLVGIRFADTSCALFKSYGNTIAEGRVEYIGFGDSSALRYASDMLLGKQLNLDEAHVLASYLVFIANRYVDGCSGGPDYKLIHSDGMTSDGTGLPFPNGRERFLYCEGQAGSALRELLMSGGIREVLTRVASPKPEDES